MVKIKLLKKLLYYWDVLFTIIDQWQLRKYLKLRTYIEDLEYGQGDWDTDEWMPTKDVEEISEEWIEEMRKKWGLK